MLPFPAGAVKLEETGIPEVDPSLNLTYWVGAPGQQVTQPDTICAHMSDDPSTIFEYRSGGWVSHSSLWKSVPQCTLSTRPTDYGQIITRNYVSDGAWRVSDLSQGTFFLKALEISGNGLKYFRNTTSYGWQVHDTGFEWRSLGLSSDSTISPAYDGLSVCAVNPLNNVVSYVANGARTDLEVTPLTHQPFAAVIGSVVIVGCASSIYMFRAGGPLTALSAVQGRVTGVYADDTSVWVATDFPTSYMSLNAGRDWVRINQARAVTPWLVIRNGLFSTVQYTATPSPPVTPSKKPTSVLPIALGLVGLALLIVSLLVGL